MITWIDRRMHRDEQGIALVTAMLVMMIATAITVGVVALSAHNSSDSAFDRNRTIAISAAEAGIDDYLASLVTANTTSVCTAFSKTLPTVPGSSYSVSITLYSTYPPVDGTQMSCPPSGQPLAAIVQSKGTAVTGGTPSQVNRTMETLLKISPSYGGFNKAIFSDSGMNLQNKLVDNGYQANDGDIYTNGNFVINNNSTISGSVYAQGTISIFNGPAIKQDVWGNGAVSISGNTSVFGKVQSSTSSITIDNNTHIYGSARAGTTVTNNGQIDGSIVQNSPSAPPPAIPFPQYPWNATVQAAWVANGFTVVNYSDCTLAQAFISAPPAGNWVVRVSPTCALSWANNTTQNLQGSMAIVTDGSITFQNQTNWNGVGGSYNLYFIVPYVSGLDCSNGAHDINFSNNTSFNSLKVAVYTQCTANIANLNAEAGQIIGGTVNINNNFTFTYAPILFPAANQTGYQAQIAYLREITT
jgi:hypothetical protein